jgi:serine/threonine protein kinase/DNA-binding PadR family transcriptional regulator
VTVPRRSRRRADAPASVGRLEAAILAALARKGARPGGPNALSGARIAEAVADASSGTARISPGGLYTMLTRLSDRATSGGNRKRGKGLITVAGKGQGRHTKLYQLTPAGLARLEQLNLPESDVWTAGTKGIEGRYAEYAIEGPFEFSGRGEMYTARITKVYSKSDLPLWATIGENVMIKCVPTRLSGPGTPFTRSETVAGYLDLVNDALRDEFETLRRLNDLPAVPDTIDCGERKVVLGGKVVAKARFIVQEIIAGEPLFRDLERRYTRRKKFVGIPVDEWFTLAEKMTSGLKDIHDAGTIHRDIWPANIVIQAKDRQPVFCDVGDAVFRKADFVELPNDKRARPYTAPEQRERPLVPSRRADLYALGCVLFRAATGHPPKFEGVIHDDAIRKAVTDDLSATPNNILRENFGIADIISRCLRVNLETRVASANSLLQDIRLFKHAGTSPIDPSAALKSLLTRIETINASRDGDVFRALATVEIADLEERLQGMADGLAVIEGGHEGITLKMSSYLSTLRKGDRYSTVTIPQFWNPRNLGSGGRYLSMNLELARRGITIRRVFLLTQSDRTRSETHAILRAHMEAQRKFVESAPGSRSLMQTRFIVLPERDVERAVNRGDQKGVWVSGNSMVELQPVYDSFGVIRVVHIRSVVDRNAVDRWFDQYWRKASVLDENWTTSRMFLES